MRKKHILTKTIIVTFEWEDADREVGIMEGGYILTDIVDADTKKQLDFSLNVYEELTQELTK
jgi:hypothetical protein